MKKILPVLILTVVLLLGVGLLVMASASTLQGETPDFYFNRQLMWLAGAIVVGFIASRFDYHNWQKWLAWKNFPLLPFLFYLFIVVLLVLTLCPGIKREINGSFRWIPLGPFSIQPGEFAKLAIVVATAIWMDYIKRQTVPAIVAAPITQKDRIKGRVVEFLREVFVPAMLLGVFAFLLYKEKDLGATVVIGVLGLSLMCVAGMRKIYLLFFGTVGGGLAALWIITDAHRLGRLMGWWNFLINPSATSDVNYHVKQSITAFKFGGLGGVGFNQSIQKYQYLPESHTDFVFAIGGEELGFFFSIGVLIAYAVLLVCGILISLRAPDRFGRLLAFGMVLLLVFQGAFNIGVVTGAFPTKGLALPFISYGGSNLITALVAVGTLFNIGRQIDEHEERTYTRVVRNAVNTV